MTSDVLDPEATDIPHGGARMVKAKKAYNANENIPKVLVPYKAADLNMHDNTAQLLIFKNGIALTTGAQAGAGVDAYPGTKPEEGDIKLTAGMSKNDVLLILYMRVRYAER